LGARNPECGACLHPVLLSPEGQLVLLDPKVMRLPVRPETYARAPAGFPNPFTDPSLGARVRFDNDRSETRYELVNSLFDRVVTFRLRELTDAWKAVHAAEAQLARRDNAEGRRLLGRRAPRLTAVPVTRRRPPTRRSPRLPRHPADRPAGRPGAVREEWDRAASPPMPRQAPRRAGPARP